MYCMYSRVGGRKQIYWAFHLCLFAHLLVAMVGPKKQSGIGIVDQKLRQTVGTASARSKIRLVAQSAPGTEP